MKKNLSYRDKLLELANIYRVNEVRNYTKNKKYLTTPQLEHILKKNKVPIPTEINKSLLEIQVRKIVKPVYSTKNKINESYTSSKKLTFKFFFSIGRGLRNLIIEIFKGILRFLSLISRATVDSLNWVYNFKSQDRKGSKFVTGFLAVSFLALVTIAGYNVFDVVKNANFIQETKNLKKEIKEEKLTKIPKPKKESQKKKIAKVPKKIEKKKQQQKKEVKEFVLPNLNLKTETILNLFDDVQYDLVKVRDEKKVRPIYFTQFPKDLDEILDIQLKKETFIKIILPLVVAENQKILNDRYTLSKVLRKKSQARSKEESSWLDSKFREYKIKEKNSLESKVLELKKRMDIIPISIALAQAAKESGWGTSRFALEGNAIFGQWTWTGTGIAPLNRDEKQSHKVLRFPILRASVKAYKNNLNTHKGYKEFREKRFLLRKKKKTVSGLKLISTLDKYAGTGKEYTKILVKIIEQNSLVDFEDVTLANTVVKKELNL